MRVLHSPQAAAARVMAPPDLPPSLTLPHFPEKLAPAFPKEYRPFKKLGARPDSNGTDMLQHLMLQHLRVRTAQKQAATPCGGRELLCSLLDRHPRSQNSRNA